MLGKFIKSSGVYLVGNVLTKMVSFLLLPLYTGHIPTEQTGYFDLTYSIICIVVSVVFFEVWSAIMLFTMNRGKEENPYKAMCNGLVLFLSSMLLYLVAGTAIGLFAGVEYLFYVLLYGVMIALQNCYSYIARAFGHNVSFVLSGAIGTLVTSVSNIVMILCFHMKITSLYLAAILGLLVQVLILESRVQVLRHFSLRYLDRKFLLKMLKFSLPLSLNGACFWFLSGYNRVGISNVLGLEANGIYGVAAKFTYILTLLGNCFSMAWQELAYAFTGDKEDKSKLYTTASGYYIRFLMFGLLLLLPAIQVGFPLLVKGDYREAFSVIPLYLLAAAASIYSMFLGNVITAEQRTSVIFYSTLAAAAVNVASFHLLVGALGLQAANLALLLGYLTNILTRLLLLRGKTTVHLPYGTLLLTALLFVGVYAVYLTNSILWNLLTFAAIFAVALIAFRDLLSLLLQKLKELGKKKSA